MGINIPPQGTFPNNNPQARRRLSLDIDLLADYPAASGSIQNTTGTIPAGSNSLFLASPIDFKNGQGISIVGAGPAATQTDGVTPLESPSSLTITPTGGTGTTAYKYWVAAIDVQYGITKPVSYSIANGEATLSSTVYNALSCPAVTGAAGYIWWGDASNPAGSQGLLGITASDLFNDVGFGPLAYLDYTQSTAGSVPPYFPLTVPTLAVGDTLITKVTGGGGSNHISLADYASNSISGAYVGHSDADVFTQFLNDCVAQHRSGHIPYANYIIDKPVNPNWNQVVSGLDIYSEQATLYVFPPISTASAGPSNYVSGNVFILYASGGFTGLSITGVNLQMWCRTSGFIIASQANQDYFKLQMNILNFAGQAAKLQNFDFVIGTIHTNGYYSPDTEDCSGLVLSNVAFSNLTVNSFSGSDTGTVVGSHALSLINCASNAFINGNIFDIVSVNSSLDMDSSSNFNIFSGCYFNKLLNANIKGHDNAVIASDINSLDALPDPSIMRIVGGQYDNQSLTFQGATTAATATAGSATLPANPAGFVEMSINGTTYKVPYYDV